MTTLKTIRTWVQGIVVFLGCLMLAGIILTPASFGYSLCFGAAAALLAGPFVLLWAVLSMLTDKA